MTDFSFLVYTSFMTTWMESWLILKLVEKWDHPYSLTMNWLRCILSFALLRSAVQCIQGARSARGRAVKAGFFHRWIWCQLRPTFDLVLVAVHPIVVCNTVLQLLPIHYICFYTICNKKSWFLWSTEHASGAVIYNEEEYWCLAPERGLLILNPTKWTGNEKIDIMMSLRARWPVNPGSNLCRICNLRGSRWCLTLGVVWKK